MVHMLRATFYCYMHRKSKTRKALERPRRFAGMLKYFQRQKVESKDDRELRETNFHISVQWNERRDIFDINRF